MTGYEGRRYGPPVRPPSEAAVRRLRELLERNDQIEAALRKAHDELAVAAYEECEVEGASRGEVAKALGVGKSTVQGWVNRGRQLKA